MAHVGNVHHALDLITAVSQITVQNILHNISTEISDVREVIYGRTAGVHTDLSLYVRDEGLSFMGGGIIQS
jgi:hypothetical protein